MIPAILSCIFVIYLYQTLNHTKPSPDQLDDDVNTLESPESLSTRINRIQERLDKLAKGSES